MSTEHDTAEELLPVPKTLYPCEYCYDEYSWYASELCWHAGEQAWVCDNCWSQSDFSDEPKGVRLSAYLDARDSGEQQPRSDTQNASLEPLARKENHA